MKEKEGNKQNDFSQNYQKSLNNYSNSIKLYTNNIQIIDGIEKIINGYKDSVLTFQKKLIQIRKNLIRPLFEEGQKNFEFSVYNKYLRYLDDIFNIHIESLSKIMNDISTKIFSEKDKKLYNYNKNILNVFQNNKNILQNKKVLIEKIFLEYNKEYKIFKDGLFSIEEDVQKYYFNLRIKKKRDPKLEKFNKLVSEASKVQEKFMETHKKFLENNKEFFQFYVRILSELENDLIQKQNFTEKNINSFILILESQLNSLFNEIKEFQKEENEEMNGGQNEFMLLREKYLDKIEFNYEKEKYKIRSINSNLVGDYLSQENKNIFKILNEEYDYELVETTTIFLNEDDIYNVVKFFCGLSLYVDNGEYNLNIEKQKFEVRKLTDKLLIFGLKKKEKKIFQDVLPINEEEVLTLQNYILKNRVYIHTFLNKINKYRTLGIFEMPNREFEIIVNLFKIIVDTTLKEKIEDDYEIINLIIILSQTFYINKEGKKYYINEELRGHNIFSDLDFLLKYVKYYINVEIKKSNSKSKTIISDKRKQEVVFATILPFINFLKEMDVNKDKLSEIIKGLSEEYNLGEEFINNINTIIGL